MICNMFTFQATANCCCPIEDMWACCQAVLAQRCPMLGQQHVVFTLPLHPAFAVTPWLPIQAAARCAWKWSRLRASMTGSGCDMCVAAPGTLCDHHTPVQQRRGTKHCNKQRAIQLTARLVCIAGAGRELSQAAVWRAPGGRQLPRQLCRPAAARIRGQQPAAPAAPVAAAAAPPAAAGAALRRQRQWRRRCTAAGRWC